MQLRPCWRSSPAVRLLNTGCSGSMAGVLSISTFLRFRCHADGSGAEAELRDHGRGRTPRSTRTASPETGQGCPEQTRAQTRGRRECDACHPHQCQVLDLVHGRRMGEGLRQRCPQIMQASCIPNILFRDRILRGVSQRATRRRPATGGCKSVSQEDRGKE